MRYAVDAVMPRSPRPPLECVTRTPGKRKQREAAIDARVVPAPIRPVLAVTSALYTQALFTDMDKGKHLRSLARQLDVLVNTAIEARKAVNTLAKAVAAQKKGAR